jgi:hypothetical protein
MKRLLEKMFPNPRIRLRDVCGMLKRHTVAPVLTTGIYKIALPIIQRERIEDVQARLKFDDNSICPKVTGSDSLSPTVYLRRGLPSMQILFPQRSAFCGGGWEEV